MAKQFQLKAKDDSQSESNANFGEQTIRFAVASEESAKKHKKCIDHLGNGPKRRMKHDARGACFMGLHGADPME